MDVGAVLAIALIVGLVLGYWRWIRRNERRRERKRFDHIQGIVGSGIVTTADVATPEERATALEAATDNVVRAGGEVEAVDGDLASVLLRRKADRADVAFLGLIRPLRLLNKSTWGTWERWIIRIDDHAWPVVCRPEQLM